MPTYDYICDACDHAFEEFQMMSAKPLRKCPACGKARLRRLIGTGAGVIFKGGGFYETDYRSESYKKDAKADQPQDKKADAKSESKSGDGGAGKTDGKAESKPGTSRNDSAPKQTKPASSD